MFQRGGRFEGENSLKERERIEEGVKMKENEKESWWGKGTWIEETKGGKNEMIGISLKKSPFSPYLPFSFQSWRDFIHSFTFLLNQSFPRINSSSSNWMTIKREREGAKKKKKESHNPGMSEREKERKFVCWILSQSVPILWPQFCIYFLLLSFSITLGFKWVARCVEREKTQHDQENNMIKKTTWSRMGMERCG